MYLYDIQIVGTDSWNLLQKDNLPWILNQKLGREVIFWDGWIIGAVSFSGQSSLYYSWKQEFQHLYC
jgi:hypothetical protein